jgi:hypothetical protein
MIAVSFYFLQKYRVFQLWGNIQRVYCMDGNNDSDKQSLDMRPVFLTSAAGILRSLQGPRVILAVIPAEKVMLWLFKNVPRIILSAVVPKPTRPAHSDCMIFLYISTGPPIIQLS